MKSERQRFAPRFGIGEIFGRSAESMPAGERNRLLGSRRGSMPCPFRKGEGMCIKSGGVCSLRMYSHQDGEARRIKGIEGHLRITCPYRFHQDDSIFSWVGETLLGNSSPLQASEVGFLRSESGSDVGRIDMVLVSEQQDRQINWCALEVQSVYFSGTQMGTDFRAIREYTGTGFPFPAGRRRPDYRSSGPKRLMPQLQIKVPTLRRWGKKMAVVVDRPFFDSIGKMSHIEHISNGDIVWFIVKLEEDTSTGLHHIVRDRIHVTTLEHATEGLTGGQPVSKEEFENRIRGKINQPR